MYEIIWKMIESVQEKRSPVWMKCQIFFSQYKTVILQEWIHNCHVNQIIYDMHSGAYPDRCGVCETYFSYWMNLKNNTDNKLAHWKRSFHARRSWQDMFLSVDWISWYTHYCHNYINNEDVLQETTIDHSIDTRHMCTTNIQ